MNSDNLILDNLTGDSGFFLRYEREIARFQSPFQEVRLVQSQTYGQVLLLDGKVQSTQVDEFIYHEALVHPAMLSHPQPRSVYIAGGGEGATLREVLRYKSVQEAVMVDLDEEVVRICREYLPSWHQGAFDDPRTRLLHEDARAILEREEKRYDVIILDLSEPVDEGPSYMLFTEEFYALCRERLNPGGLVVTQSGCPSFVYAKPFHSVTLTMERVFAKVAPYLVFIPSFASNWGFTVASDRWLPLDVPVEEMALRMENFDRGLQFLDPEYLPGMFRLPKHLKVIKNDVGRVIRDGKPLIVI
ncbi:MAG: polyamine aminopropyltransferase [bacterium]|nr:MAG: polyamine aminopropyltransferase [bacterium]